MINIKDYREKELKWYILSYILFVVLINYQVDFTNSNDIEWILKVEMLLTSIISSSIICSISYVFDSIYSEKIKVFLIFTLAFKKYPGTTIFTRIKESKVRDYRVKCDEARRKYEDIITNIPTLRKEKSEFENIKWNKIYSLHLEDRRVLSVHRDYLLCRDLYTTTFTMTILTLIMIATNLLQFSCKLIGYLVFMLVITNFAAQNKANRFVNTVISVDLSKK